MRLTVPVTELREALAAVLPAVKPNSPAREVQNVLFEGDGGGSATLTGTDLELAVRAGVGSVAAGAPEPFRLLLPPDKLNSILSTVRADTLEFVSSGPDRVEIRAGSSRFGLPLADPAAFPAFDPVAGDDYHEVQAGDFRTLLKRASFAVKAGETKYGIAGVLLRFGPTSVTSAGTDGNRLAMQAVPAAVVGAGVAETLQPIVPVKAVKLLDRLVAGSDDPVALAVEAGQNGEPKRFHARGGRWALRTALHAGRFPNPDHAMAQRDKATRTAAGKAGDLWNAAAQVSAFTSETTKAVVMELKGSAARFRAAAADVGEGEAEAGLARFDGDPVEVAFQAQFLRDGLGVLDDDADVTVEVLDPTLGVFFSSGDFRYVVQPVTFQD